MDLAMSEPRLLSMTWLGNGRWGAVTPDGNLNLVSSGDVLDTVQGNFGTTRNGVPSRGTLSRSPDINERIRLAPGYLKPDKILAAVENPAGSNRLSSQLFGDGSPPRVMVRLFRIRRNQLIRTGFMGPLRGRIIDMDVSNAAPQQLLWLRIEPPDTYHLEMIELARD